MMLEHIERNLRRRGLLFSLAPPATDSDLAELRARTGLEPPPQVEQFYRAFNGLSVEEPRVEVWPLARLDRGVDGRMPFSVFDGSHVLAFETTAPAVEGHWQIVAIANGAHVTHTMASFWTNTLFK